MYLSIRLVVSACMLLVLAACSSSPAVSAAPTSAPASVPATEPPATAPAEDEPTPGTALSACELATPEDIEVALGFDSGTVDAGDLRETPTSLDPASNECRYQGAWGGLVVAVTPTDGVNVYGAVESTFGEDAEALAMGDGGLWFEDDNRGYFLKGSVMVRLQFTHLTSGELDSFRDPTVELGEAAIARL